MNWRNWTILLVCVVLATLSAYSLAGATTYGPVPLYDSGWVECAGRREYQAFFHGLGALATDWDIFVRHDTTLYTTLAPTQYHVNTSSIKWRGYKPADLAVGHLYVKWMDYIAYSYGQGSWFDADDPHVEVRLLMWAEDGPPERP